MGALIDARIPPPIQPLLAAYLTLVERQLPGFLAGFYLHGSIALGAFNPRFSDIDFVAVVSRSPTSADLRHLREIHRAVARQFPRWPLEGSYLQRPDLGQPPRTISARPAWHNGRLDPAGRLNFNRVTWWLLKTHGIALRGPEPSDLDFSVDWADLIAEMKRNLNTYWARWTKNPRNVAWLLTDGGVQWAVLGVLRQYYTFRENDIISKSGAGEYALGHMPEEWYRLIREAIRCREGAGKPLYHSRIARAVEVVRFMRYIVPVCNALSV